MNAETGFYLYMCIFFGTIIGSCVVRHLVNKRQED